MYYVEFKGKSAKLYTSTKTLVRQFNVAAEIINAQVTGSGKNACVALTMQNGKTVVYRSDGTIMRK